MVVYLNSHLREKNWEPYYSVIYIWASPFWLHITIICETFQKEQFWGFSPLPTRSTESECFGIYILLYVSPELEWNNENRNHCDPYYVSGT